MEMSTKRRESLRERVRQLGQSGNYWYAVELSKNLKKGKSTEVIFWKTSIALFRGEDGIVRALENRCAHRQLRLTTGVVDGNDLICQYHGWTYDEQGTCVKISHEIGKGQKDKLPKIKIQSFPIQEKYGFIWLFPGDPDLADQVAMPAVPQLDQEKPWKFIPIDMTINAHYSMILENVCDFNHAFLHRDLRPFTDPHLTGYEREGDSITINYDTDLSKSQMVRIGGEKQGRDFDKMTLWYRYPYQASDISGKYLHWLFMVPIDEKTTRCFFMFLFGPIEIPVIRYNIPQTVRRPILWLINKFYVKPLLSQDLWALEEEQKAHDNHPDEHHYEFNPIVREFQKLSEEKWNQYLETEVERQERERSEGNKFSFPGAGLSRLDLASFQMEQDALHNTASS